MVVRAQEEQRRAVFDYRVELIEMKKEVGYLPVEAAGTMVYAMYRGRNKRLVRRRLDSRMKGGRGVGLEAMGIVV